MPPKGEPLSAAQVAILRTWIDQGAKWPDRAGDAPEAVWWSLRPLARPPLPSLTAADAKWVRTPDRRLRPRQAAREGAGARAGGRPAHADPPAVLRPDRPAADAGGGRRVRRRHRSATPTRSWWTACSPRRTTASAGRGTGSTWSTTATRTATTRTSRGPTPGRIAITSSAPSTATSRTPASSQEQLAGDVLFPGTRRRHRGARLHRRRAVGLHRPRRGAGDEDRRQDRPPPRPRRHGGEHHRHLHAASRCSAPSATTTSSIRSRRRITTACRRSSRPSIAPTGATTPTRPSAKRRADLEAPAASCCDAARPSSTARGRADGPGRSSPSSTRKIAARGKPRPTGRSRRRSSATTAASCRRPTWSNGCRSIWNSRWPSSAVVLHRLPRRLQRHRRRLRLPACASRSRCPTIPSSRRASRSIADQTTARRAEPRPRAADASRPAARAARYVRVTATKLAPRQNDFIFALAELEVLDAAGKNVARRSGRSRRSIPSRRRRAGARRTLWTATSPAPAGRRRRTGHAARRARAAASPTPCRRRGPQGARRRRPRAGRRRMRELADAAAAARGLRRRRPHRQRRVPRHRAGRRQAAADPRPAARRRDASPARKSAPGRCRVFPDLPARFDLPPDHAEGERRAALAHWI